MGRGRAPCCDKTKVRTGPWSPAEDSRLMNFIQKYGHTNWRALPKQAGLLRCGKSCRLRWINYLRPDVKRGNFTPQEENTIIQLHNSFGNKWSKIASCLPGRTDNEIKNVWNTHLKKRVKKDESVEKKAPVVDDKEAKEKPWSPSSSSCVSNSSDHLSPTKQEALEVGDNVVTSSSEFDVDFWQVLELLDPLQPRKTQESVIEIEEKVEEVEIGKWLRVLENELGLGNGNEQEITSAAALVEFSAIWPNSPAHAHDFLGI